MPPTPKHLFSLNGPVAILGLARTGNATARALLSSNIEVWAWDDDLKKREEASRLDIPVVDLSKAPLEKVSALVLSPGIPHTYPQPHPIVARIKAAGIPIIGDIELLARAQKMQHYVGITGTNGKSTTTALIGHIFQEANQSVSVGGNLGYPALDLSVPALNGFYILELSSYQLELTHSLTFDIAILLNISPDHLERHGGMEGYIAAKKSIFKNQVAPQTAIIGVDDEWSSAIYTELQRTSKAWIIPISIKQPVPQGVYADKGILFDDMDGGNKPVLELAMLRNLPGLHNAQNIAAAYAATRAAKIDPHAIITGLKSFPGLVHRQQRVADIHGIGFINDSKATNADATAKALACYQPVYWILGGRPKEGGLNGLESYMPRIAHAFLIGEAAEEFAKWLLVRKVPYTQCGDLKTATLKSATMAFAEKKPNATVLLSPACASLDQFTSYEERGNLFIEYVKKLS